APPLQDPLLSTRRMHPTSVTESGLQSRAAPDDHDVANSAATSQESPVSFLTIDDVTATYREGKAILTALAGVSFAVAPAEFVAIIGPSGSGKSTLLDLVAGLSEPDAGAIHIHGAATTARDRLRFAAYMHQRDLLMPWRTALDNAAVALEAAGMPRTRARDIARARLPEFGLDGFASTYPSQLSGGMRQRVAFLRTILADRPLLLLDEPFGALDAFTRAGMQDFLLDLLARERRTVLLVTHDVEEAILLADRVVTLSPAPGRVVHIESVALPRPRSREIVTDPQFVAHKATILRALGLIDRSTGSDGR
ncbi:MAG: ABC transporter ATP-binding protein, partial [Thermomicrobiales bacterium]